MNDHAGTFQGTFFFRHWTGEGVLDSSSGEVKGAFHSKSIANCRSRFPRNAFVTTKCSVSS